jgi:hypothetical protein
MRRPAVKPTILTVRQQGTIPTTARRCLYDQTRIWKGPPMAATPQNLLVLMSDEHNRKIAGHAGHPIVNTPALDALAAHGSCFTPLPLPLPRSASPPVRAWRPACPCTVTAPGTNAIAHESPEAPAELVYGRSTQTHGSDLPRQFRRGFFCSSPWMPPYLACFSVSRPRCRGQQHFGFPEPASRVQGRPIRAEAPLGVRRTCRSDEPRDYNGRIAMNLTRHDLAAAGAFALSATTLIVPAMAATDDQEAVKQAVEALRKAILTQDKATLETLAG